MPIAAPIPGCLPLLIINLEKSFKKFQDLSKLAAGVGVFGSAAAYALVWELGSLRLLPFGPGPKTTWGKNRYGQKAILTKQAPRGYVGVNAKQIRKIFNQEIKKVKIDLMDFNISRLRLEVALDNAALRAARLISDTAPVDSGDLRTQIQSVSTDEYDKYVGMADEDEGVLFL